MSSMCHIAFQFTMTERSFFSTKGPRFSSLANIHFPHGLIFQDLQNFLKGYMDFKIFFIHVSNLS